MKKIISIIFFSFFSVVVNAENSAPLPTKGLEIIPMAKMNIPEFNKQDLIKKKTEEKANGYSESYNEYANFLLTLNNHAANEIQAYKNNESVYDTHLKNSLSQIKLAFKFKPIKQLKKNEIIGYAPIGSFIDNGWTGIKIFFNMKSLGVCSYSLFNLKLSHGAVQLNNETTEYLVNNKPSSRLVEGNFHNGFLYTIDWFTADEMKLLECADMKLDKSRTQKMINLASKLDKN